MKKKKKKERDAETGGRHRRGVLADHGPFCQETRPLFSGVHALCVRSLSAEGAAKIILVLYRTRRVMDRFTAGHWITHTHTETAGRILLYKYVILRGEKKDSKTEPALQ